MNLPQLNKRIEELEDLTGEGELNLIRIEWEDGTPVATWEMRGDTFIRVVPPESPDIDSHIYGTHK